MSFSMAPRPSVPTRSDVYAIQDLALEFRLSAADGEGIASDRDRTAAPTGSTRPFEVDSVVKQRTKNSF